MMILFVSINVFVGGGRERNQHILHHTGYIEFINLAFLVSSGWLDVSNFKVFVEFSADEHGLNCGLHVRAEVC